MIWTTWRQHRAEAAVGALILAALAAVMVVIGSTARDRARALGLPACRAARACPGALIALHNDFRLIPSVTAALIALPLLAGMFFAAPLVSREYEAGTHRLAWTQSVSPRRWITIKIVLIFGVLASAALALGLLATWTLDPLTAAFGGRYNSVWHDVQGMVPVACILFAFAVGVAASALIRRTIPAMAVTLAAYAVTRIPIEFIRARFAPRHDPRLHHPAQRAAAEPGRRSAVHRRPVGTCHPATGCKASRSPDRQDWPVRLRDDEIAGSKPATPTQPPRHGPGLEPTRLPMERSCTTRSIASMIRPLRLRRLQTNTSGCRARTTSADSPQAPEALAKFVI